MSVVRCAAIFGTLITISIIPAVLSRPRRLQSPYSPLFPFSLTQCL